MLLLIVLLSLLLNPLPFQKFTIIGSVRDTAGRSVPNVRVLVTDENFQPIRTIFVDSSGQFFVRGLSPGRYHFRVETSGTPYQEHETGWIELQSLRQRAGGAEDYPLDIVLKLKPNKIGPRTETLFVQNVPQPARAAYELGVKSFREGQFEAGLAALKQALELFPDYFSALELLGRQQVKAGQYEAALLVLLHAVQINTRGPGSYYALGVAYLKLKQLDAAIECLNKSANFDPANANTQMMLGIALGHNQQLAESEAAFRKALQLGGIAAAEAHFYLAGIYEKQRRYAAAAAALGHYLKESKELKDPDKVREMIRNLKEKEKDAAR